MPRITPAVSRQMFRAPVASMRPGRNAPDNVDPGVPRHAAAPRFNEAGAKCPG